MHGPQRCRADANDRLHAYTEIETFYRTRNDQINTVGFMAQIRRDMQVFMGDTFTSYPAFKKEAKRIIRLKMECCFISAVEDPDGGIFNWPYWIDIGPQYIKRAMQQLLLSWHSDKINANTVPFLNSANEAEIRALAKNVTGILIEISEKADILAAEYIKNKQMSGSFLGAQYYRARACRFVANQSTHINRIVSDLQQLPLYTELPMQNQWRIWRIWNWLISFN